MKNKIERLKRFVASLSLQNKVILSGVAIALIVLLIIVFFGSHKMKGKYVLTQWEFDDWKYEADENAYFDISGVDDNSICEFYYQDNGASDRIFGYVALSRETNEAIKYKFWVTSQYGSTFFEEMDYFYIYYYPKTSKIMLNAGDDTMLWFEK